MAIGMTTSLELFAFAWAVICVLAGLLVTDKMLRDSAAVAPDTRPAALRG